jgi:hypothetical protein
MGVPGNANTLLLKSAAAGGAYEVSRSLRFNSGDSAYLSRTPASAGNRKKFTYSVWTKLAAIGTLQAFISARSDDNNRTTFFYQDSQLKFQNIISGSSATLNTSAVFRDPSAWYHILLSVDTDQGTSGNRVKIYVNGVEQALSGSYPGSGDSTQINNNVTHGIGRIEYQSPSPTGYFDGYMADPHLIDGIAADPSSFAETDATTGQWVPKAFTGSYGTNGFKLNFSSNSTTAALGTDSSGAGNTWSVNNFSVTAGSGNDSLVDSPTNGSQTDTGVGGEVVGNYATLNPLNSGGSGTPTLTNGNLDFSLAPSVGAIGTHAMGSIAVTAGKYYWEVNLTSNYLNAIYIGLMRGADYNTYHNTSSGGVLYYGGSGNKVIDGVFTSYGNSYTNNDIIGIALDVDAGTVTFYKNNSSQGVITLPSSTSGWKAYVANGASGGTQAGVINFGQRPFAYTAPSGFKALCTTNLAEPTIADGSTAMDVKLYTGNGSTQTISGLNFSPDLIWIKTRGQVGDHKLIDIVRGGDKRLESNTTDAEETNADTILSFDSDGFTLGSSGTVNGSGYSLVAWTWDAGSSTVTNTQGSITSQVRANASAGFSVVTYTGNATAGATIGHGLGVAPGMIIIKNRDDGGTYWVTYHSSLGGTKALALNLTDSVLTNSLPFNNTNPTSTVFSVGGGGAFSYSNNQSSENHVAYCFAPVAGYSSFGSYTGNGSTDGPFVYTGFRPRWVMIKRTQTCRMAGTLLTRPDSSYNAAE